ncbi:nucleotidyltransferase domain-containing protein [Caminibacter pacificus]
MRLSQKEIETIKKIIIDFFGESEIYLFGSRVDDMKVGGDIDLFVIPKNREGNLFEKKIKASVKLENLLQLPVDIVVHYDFERLIEKEALKGIKL